LKVFGQKKTPFKKGVLLLLVKSLAHFNLFFAKIQF